LNTLQSDVTVELQDVHIKSKEQWLYELQTKLTLG